MTTQGQGPGAFLTVRHLPTSPTTIASPSHKQQHAPHLTPHSQQHDPSDPMRPRTASDLQEEGSKHDPESTTRLVTPSDFTDASTASSKMASNAAQDHASARDSALKQTAGTGLNLATRADRPPALVLPVNPRHVRGGCIQRPKSTPLSANETTRDGLAHRHTHRISPGLPGLDLDPSPTQAMHYTHLDTQSHAGRHDGGDRPVDQMIPLQECAHAVRVPLLHRHLEMQYLLACNAHLFANLAAGVGQAAYKALLQLWTETTRQAMPDGPWLAKTKQLLHAGPASASPSASTSPTKRANLQLGTASSSPTSFTNSPRKSSMGMQSPGTADCAGKHYWALFCDVVGFDPHEVLAEEYDTVHHDTAFNHGDEAQSVVMPEMERYASNTPTQSTSPGSGSSSSNGLFLTVRGDASQGTPRSLSTSPRNGNLESKGHARQLSGAGLVTVDETILEEDSA